MRQHVPATNHFTESVPAPAPANFTSALFRRDGSPVDYAALAESLVGPALTSYPEPRHLVGICPTDDVLDASATKKLPFDRSAPLPLGDGQKDEAQWARERLEWESAFVLRSLLSDYDSRLSEPCGDEGKVLQHAKSDRQRLTPYRCQVRATCPCCARAYSQGRGAELVALMDGLLQPGRLLVSVPDVKAWHLVLSCDPRVSAEVDDLVAADDRDSLRRVMRHLTEDVHATLRRVFGPGVAASVAWHWWHSSDPASGRHHVHAHVTIPNISVRLSPESGEWVPDMTPLRRKGKLPNADLLALKSIFGERVASHRWARALGITALNWSQNVHVRFTTQRDGQGYAHRSRYDGRTSMADMLDMVSPDVLRDARQLHAGMIGEGDVQTASVDVAELACNPENLAWWVRAASMWQGIQTIRYTGWLVNSARKRLGLLRDVSAADPEWSSIGLYRVLDASAAGVQVERWTSAGRQVQHWHQDHVQLLPAPGAVTSWCWSDDVRPLKLSGPPAAWLSRAGLVA